MKDKTLKLIQNDQLRLNLGGWVMNDEANPTISAEIRQMMDGHQFILSEFGVEAHPKAGWHVDPFGSSKVTAGLFAQIGFDAFGINRINYKDLQHRKESQNLEFIWKGSDSLGEESFIFTHILDSYYCTPPEIDFSGIGQVNIDSQYTGMDGENSFVTENYDKNQWINTNRNLPSYPVNYVEMAQTFLSDCKNRGKWYKHNQLLIPFGCDFSHTNMYMSYIQMDKLMHYINSNKTYNATVLYSTLYDYVLAVNQLNITWDLEENTDFFNYLSGSHGWWTGYFSSRPDLKLAARESENILRVSEALYVFATNMMKPMRFNETEAMENITLLRHAEDIVQHHDAITGTSSDYVTKDYIQMLNNGKESVTYFVNDIVGQILSTNHTQNSYSSSLAVDRFDALNHLTASNVAPLVLFNSLPWTITKLITVQTNRTDLVVYDKDNHLIISQINPVINHYNAYNKYNLHFIAEQLKGLSLATYFIKQATSDTEKKHNVVGKVEALRYDEVHQDTVIGSGFYSLVFDGNNGFLSAIINHNISKTMNATNYFVEYASQGTLSNIYDNIHEDGPYVMRPLQDNRYQMPSSNGKRMLQITLPFRQIAICDNCTNTINPGFVAQAHVMNQQERYMAHICHINATAFDVQFFNVDNNPWGPQNRFVDWITFNEYYSDYFDSKHYDSVSITTQTNDSYSQIINIDLSKYKFESVPMIFTSIRKLNCDDKESFYSATIIKLTQTSATVMVARSDTFEPWPNTELFLDYVVFENGINTPIQRTHSHNITIALDNIHSDHSFNFNISFPQDHDHQFIVNEPVVLLQISQMNTKENTSLWTTTAINNSKDGFILSMDLRNAMHFTQSNEHISLNVMYWAFERIVIKQKVSNQLVYSELIRGPIFDEMQQTFAANYSQTFKVFNHNTHSPDLNYIAYDVSLGWIKQYSQTVSHFDILDSDFQKDTNISICQNSLEYIQRSYNPYCDERVSCNFWPTSSQSFVSDTTDSVRFGVISDQAHATGWNKMYKTHGDHYQYEVMLQRRCASDAHSFPAHHCLGLGRNSGHLMYLLMDASPRVSYLMRRLMLLQQYKPIQLFAVRDDLSMNKWKKQMNLGWFSMANELDDNIHLLQLRYAYEQSRGLVAMLWHMFEVNESKKYSRNVSVDVGSIFNPNILNITKLTEMQLTANMPITDLNRLKWKYRDANGNSKILDKDSEQRKKERWKDAKTMNTKMSPRNIRTFVVNQNVNQKYNQKTIKNFH